MAVVNSLVFNNHSGAIIADEEYWFLRRRKSFFADYLHELIEPEIADDFGLDVVYGAVGTPSFQFEVAEKTRREIRRRWQEWKDKGARKPPFETVEQVGRLLIEITQKVIRRKVDEKLRFFYGFSTDDFIRGSFTHDDRKVDILQDKVRSRAKGIVEYTEKSPMVKSIYDNVGVLLGWDRAGGMGNYHIKAENCVLSLVSGRFEAVGKGKYASAMVLTHYLQNKTLAERRAGIDRLEGTLQLIKATLTAGEYFQEAGGHLNMIYIDGSGKDHARRVTTITHDRMKLATEVVLALEADLVPAGEAQGLVDDIVFGNANLERAEERFFAQAFDAKRLEFLLRGYKVQNWRETDEELATMGKPAKKTKGK